jgi:hypothetical protein
MKKLLFLLAVAGMISIVACKSKENKAEGNADSVAMEQPVDTAAAVATDTTQVK